MLHDGRCHCGFVRFRVEVEITHVRLCNCSVCHMRGALMFRVPEVALELLTPLEDLRLYQWGSMTAKDYFCPHCGILPFRRPSAPTARERAQGVLPFWGLGDQYALSCGVRSGFGSGAPYRRSGDLKARAGGAAPKLQNLV